MSEWIDKQIEDFFDYTIAGDWGVEPTLDDATAVIGTANFRNDGKIDFRNTVARKIEKSRLEKRQINKGDILFEKSGGSTDQLAGRVVYCDTDFGGTCSNFVEVAKVKKDFDSRFIFYLLFYLYGTGRVAKYQQQTTGIINFKLNEYKKEQTKIPDSKLEQSAIAQVLLNIDEATEQTEKLIAKQQRIKRGLLQDLLTRGIDEHGAIRSEATHEFKGSPLGRIPKEWEACRLDNLVMHVGSGVTPTGGSKIYESDGIIFIRSQNVHFDELILDDVVFINEETNKQMVRSQVLENDVLLNITGASIGRCCAVPLNFPDANVNQHVCIIRLKDSTEADANFLVSVLSSEIGQRQIKALNAGGNREGLNYQQVRNIIIPFPEEEERRRISAFLNAGKESLSEDKIHLEKLRVLKTGLMQDLLTGKVRVSSEQTN